MTTLSSPNYVTGAINYYWADRDPTASEPDIIVGLLDPAQILYWKNAPAGTLWFLKSALDNGNGTYTLSWVEFGVASH